MSKARLSFPFSFLARPLRAPASPCPGRDTAILARPLYRAPLSTSSRRRAPETANQRYGTANEPPPHLDTSKKAPTPINKPSSPQTTAGSERQARIGPPQYEATIDQTKDAAKSSKIDWDNKSQGKGENTVEQQQQQQQATQAKESDPTPTATGNSAKTPEVTYSTSQSALNTIMGMEPPMSDDSAASKPPHLRAPRYVHHFDTYTIARDLQTGGFSEEEAITLMKAMRAVLADNMQLAQEGLVSKGDEEMTAYLFRAACSELRTEIRNSRSTLTDQMRTERTSLQHEVDILSQRITADTANLKDELKGMFDDRKMAVRMERRDIENKIQEINYNITTRLNSEMKSEVEGLRWVLVRRTAMALVIVAVTALLTLQIAKQGEKRKDHAEAAKGGGARNDEGQPQGKSVRAADASENPELVSLG